VGTLEGVLREGALIEDRYRLRDRLASGGMGDVWRATDESLGRTVAVKVLRPELLTEPTFSARFRSEARMLAALRHPGVVAVYDFGESNGRDGDPITYLVMEYVEGEPLSQVLAGGKRLSAAETLAIVAGAADALHAANSAGIVHRDVKPSNLMLQPDGSVVLVDFGVARSTSGNTNLTSTNAVIGTAKYMAPEQASGKEVSSATDIYALGAVAYHCLSGHPPFTGDNPLEIAVRHVTEEPPALPDDIPPPVRELVSRALEKHPADRYPSAAAFASAARAVDAAPEVAEPAMVRSATTASDATSVVYAGAARINGGGEGGSVARPETGDPATPPDPVVTPQRRRRLAKLFLAVAVAVALLLIGGLAKFLLVNRDDSDPPAGNVPPASPASGTQPSQSPQPGVGGNPTQSRQPSPGGGGNRTTRAPAQSPRRTPPPETEPEEPGLPTRLPTELPTTILPTIIPPIGG
jgi:serine/threonine protein kinase